eukprot:Selendium_serpulae@DN2375_c1_g1_i3.p1
MNQKHIVSDVPRHGFCDPLIQKLEPLSTDSRSEFAHHFTVRFVCFGTARTTRLFKIGFCVFPKPPSSLYEFTFFCYENLFDWACNARGGEEGGAGNAVRSDEGSLRVQSSVSESALSESSVSE